MALAALSLLAVPVSAQPTIDYSPIVRNLVENYAVPKSAVLAETFAKLPEAIDAACADPASAEKKAAFANAFRESVDAYVRVAVLRFGALADENRLERLAFIPDARSVVRRQVDRLMAKPDPKATKPEGLREKSVALQGLSALEWVAFSSHGDVVLDGSSEKGAFACGYAGAIAARLTNTAENLKEAYGKGEGQTGLLLSPSPENPLVKTQKEAVEEVFNALLTGLALLRDQVLERVLEQSDPRARAARAPFSRSGNEFVYLAGGLGALGEAIAAGGFVEAAPEDGRWLSGSLSFENKLAVDALNGFSEPLSAVLGDEKARRRLEVIALGTANFRDLMGKQLAGYLELSGGFNALDGD
ncbi:hypothetical protein GR183_17125 [Stappia sp. GBMRC 2046]|uniref:Imelysin-like domain-containing protein n=1 Tax=Stappia sediminis TaxID=2692190 RepID=A0A7X3LWZ9_9HYPH|nr:hypothetical protein [Stappia sediminis]